MNRDKQIQKVNNMYNSMCCLLVYRDKSNLNSLIDDLKVELDKLKIRRY